MVFRWFLYNWTITIECMILRLTIVIDGMVNGFWKNGTMVNNSSEKRLVQKNANHNKNITQTGINLLETKPHVIEVFLRN